MAKRVYQIKITLNDISPEIWRRIQVPEDYNFWDLHVAIQDAMGWLDSHLHMFNIKPKHSRSIKKIGIPDFDDFAGEQDILPGWEVPISNYCYEVGTKVDYEYDFGDGWEHKILIEGIMLREKEQRYPKCLSGARACPPEDCGGVPGYYHVLEVIADPSNEEYKDMMTWLDGKYDPEEFDQNKVIFDDPKKRWENAFSDGI